MDLDFTELIFQKEAKNVFVNFSTHGQPNFTLGIHLFIGKT